MTYDPSQPPQQPYVPPQQPQQYSPLNQEAAGLMKAGKVAVWLWIAGGAAVLLVILGCFGLCLLGGVIGAATPTPTTTP